MEIDLFLGECTIKLNKIMRIIHLFTLFFIMAGINYSQPNNDYILKSAIRNITIDKFIVDTNIFWAYGDLLYKIEDNNFYAFSVDSNSVGNIYDYLYDSIGTKKKINIDLFKYHNEHLYIISNKILLDIHCDTIYNIPLNFINQHETLIDVKTVDNLLYFLTLEYINYLTIYNNLYLFSNGKFKNITPSYLKKDFMVDSYLINNDTLYFALKNKYSNYSYLYLNCLKTKLEKIILIDSNETAEYTKIFINNSEIILLSEKGYLIRVDSFKNVIKLNTDLKLSSTESLFAFLNFPFLYWGNSMTILSLNLDNGIFNTVKTYYNYYNYCINNIQYFNNKFYINFFECDNIRSYPKKCLYPGIEVIQNIR